MCVNVSKVTQTICPLERKVLKDSVIGGDPNSIMKKKEAILSGWMKDRAERVKLVQRWGGDGRRGEFSRSLPGNRGVQELKHCGRVF